MLKDKKFFGPEEDKLKELNNTLPPSGENEVKCPREEKKHHTVSTPFKRLLSIITVALIMTGLCGPITVVGANSDVTVDGIVYELSSSGSEKIATVVGYTKEIGSNVTIPATVSDDNNNNYKVTAIGAKAFNNCEALKEIVIPDSVTTIGNWAFNNCNALKAIVIPDSVTTTGYGAFYACAALTKIVIPDSVTTTGNKTFGFCTALETIIIPDSVKTIGTGAFTYCKALKTIVIPDSVTTIGVAAFYGCEALDEIVIPDSVTTISNGAFGSCKALTTVKIGNGVTTIGNLAFDECAALTTVTIGNRVETIGLRAFNYCAALEKIVIPDSVTTIEAWAFNNCEALTEIVIPYSVTTIGIGAFCGCNSLQSIVIPNSVTTIEGETFYGCTGLQNIVIPDSVTTIGKSAFSYCKALKTITIPNSVTTIGTSVFDGCTALETIIIPDTVSTIGTWAFYNCNALKRIFYHEDLNVENTQIPGGPVHLIYKVTNSTTTPKTVEIKEIKNSEKTAITLCPHSMGPYYIINSVDDSLNDEIELKRETKLITIEATDERLGSETETCKHCGATVSFKYTIKDGTSPTRYPNDKLITDTARSATKKVTIGNVELELILQDPLGAFEDGTLGIDVTGLDPNSQKYKDIIAMLDEQDIEFINLLEISPTVNGTNISGQLSNKVRLLIKIPEGWDKDELAASLVQVGDDKTFNVTIDGDYLVIWTDHFSPYAFMDLLSDEEKKALEKDELGNDSHPSESYTIGKSTQTGENNTMLYSSLGFGLASLAGALFVVLKGRQKD